MKTKTKIQLLKNPTYSHSIKISDTAKGIRIDVHVYANSTGEAIEQAFTTYLKARQTAMDPKINKSLSIRADEKFLR